MSHSSRFHSRQLIHGSLLLFILITSACSNAASGSASITSVTITGEPSVGRVVRLRAEAIAVRDLPNGMVRFGLTEANMPSWVMISEYLYSYNSTADAEAAYKQLEREDFPTITWQPRADLEFPHHADQLHVACLPMTVDGLSHIACAAVGRYDRLLVEFIVNLFPDKWLTPQEFRAVLERADQKIVSALKRTPTKL